MVTDPHRQHTLSSSPAVHEHLQAHAQRVEQLRLEKLEAEFKAAEKARRERAAHRQVEICVPCLVSPRLTVGSASTKAMHGARLHTRIACLQAYGEGRWGAGGQESDVQRTA